MAMAGKNLRVQVATTQVGPYNTIPGLNDATMTIDGDNQDISTFGSDFVKRLQGLKDGSYSLGGFYEQGDTTGQVAIRAALLNDTRLWVNFLPDGATGFRQEVKVATFETTAAADGMVEVSIDLEGTDAITLI